MACGIALIQLYLLALLARPPRDFNKKNKKARISETSKKVVRTLTQAVVSFVTCSLATITFALSRVHVGLKGKYASQFEKRGIRRCLERFAVFSRRFLRKMVENPHFSLSRKRTGEKKLLASKSSETKKFYKSSDFNV